MLRATAADVRALTWHLQRRGFPLASAHLEGGAVVIAGPLGPVARLTHDHPACWRLCRWEVAGFADTGRRGDRDGLLDAVVAAAADGLEGIDEGEVAPYRRVVVPDVGHGMRLDRFLASRFADRSRSFFASAVRDGRVLRPDGVSLDAAHLVRGGDLLHLFIDGLAPGGPPPAPPTILHADADIVAIDKPAGLLAHPVGTAYAWSVIRLMRAQFPGEPIDLIHRLDRDTTGVQLLSRTPEANRFVKAHLHDEGTVKRYVALCKGHAAFSHLTIEAPIGEARGDIRIQQAVRADGAEARTDVEVLGVARHPDRTLVSCRIHTGRTHQIRVHLQHVGLPLWGDRLYGVPPEVFLRAQAEGVDAQTHRAAGATRQLLHAAQITVAHPRGGWLTVDAPWPDDLRAAWEHGEGLFWPQTDEAP
jgi:23S rRNA pseudouridine1911/1915/1917 synthase